MDEYDRGNEELTDTVAGDAGRATAGEPARGEGEGLFGTLQNAVETFIGGRTTEEQGTDTDVAPGVDRVGGGVDREVGTPTGASGLDQYQEAVSGESSSSNEFRRDETGNPAMTERGFDSESTGEVP